MDYSAYNILVVDDEISYLVLKAILGKDAFQVFWASNTDKASTILETQDIDLILIDIQLLQSSASAFARPYPEEHHEHIPMVFMTSIDSSDDIAQGFDLGGRDYVTKPFHEQALPHRIKHHIALRHAQHIIKKQQKELQETTENRDKLFALMAHDLRSPISSLKMILNILAMKTEENPADEDYLEMLYSSSDIAEKLFSLVDNILKWTKSSLGLLSYVPQEFELEDTLLSVIEVLVPTAKLKNISFELTLDEKVTVYFDVDIMKSILRNLLINAVKYSHPDSTILVGLRKEDAVAVLEVKDYGVGMTPKVQEELKKKTIGRSLTGTAKEGGTGLGLWLVQHFLQANKGEFYFESQENEGSTFGIKIPLSQMYQNA